MLFFENTLDTLRKHALHLFGDCKGVLAIYKSYIFRLYPNKKQQQIINQSIGNARFVYNYFLNAKKEEYKEKVGLNLHFYKKFFIPNKENINIPNFSAIIFFTIIMVI